MHKLHIRNAICGTYMVTLALSLKWQSDYRLNSQRGLKLHIARPNT